jgi:uncharacterized membrane protein
VADSDLNRRETKHSLLVTVRDRLRTSLWFIPALFVSAAVVLEQATMRIDEQVEPSLPFVGFIDDPSTAADMLTTIASSTLTFLGVVFSITIVAIQLASSQFSPRVLRTFLASRITQIALGSFVSTFVYALLALRRVDAGGDEVVGGLSVFVAVVLVLSTVAVFIAFVHHIVHSMRVVNIIEAVASETRSTIDALYPAEDDDPGEQADPDLLGEPSTPVTYLGRSAVLAGVDLARLVRLARQHEVVIDVEARIGEFLPHGVPVATVHGETSKEVDGIELCATFELADERTAYQDVAFGIRQLVDIASRALSTGINDPTTAGQAIDRIVDLLRRIARRPEPTEVHRDDDGNVRVLTRRVGWDDLVTLAFTEIRTYGIDSVQVTRRLVAALEDLSAVVADRDPQRLTALERERNQLEASVTRAFPDETDRRLALTADRTGIG